MNLFNKKQQTNTIIKEKPKDPSKLAEAIYDEKAEGEDMIDEEIEKEDNFDEMDSIPTSSPKVQEQEVVEQPPIKEAQVWLELAGYVRRLRDAEEQIHQRRIFWKSSENVSGIMTMAEVVTVAETLKYNIETIGDVLIDLFKINEEKVEEKIKEYASVEKVYTYWTR